MTKDELKLALKHAKRDERHLSNAETRYWCDQYKLLATQAIEALAQPEPVSLEAVYETIIQWDEGGGKRSRRELARRIVSLYTTPSQRTWVGLTYEDMVSLQKDLHDDKGEIVLPTTFAQAVEAKLKEKNT